MAAMALRAPLSRFSTPRLWDISPPVHAGSPVFPGDAPFSLQWTARISPGCPVNVSKLTLIPHTGAHADAPLHYGDEGAAIGEVALEAERRHELVDAVLDLLAKHGARMAPMSARDFDLLLLTRDDLPDATEGEIDEVLCALSTPLLGLLDRNEHGAVRFVSRPDTVAATLRILADRITHTSRVDEPDST